MYKERYLRCKQELLDDPEINPSNKKITKKFLEYEEYILKRRNGLPEVDERSYKTLYAYVGKIKNINQWFNNEPWSNLKKKQIQEVIDDLEDGVIKNPKGQRYADRAWYYQIMKGELFRMVKKNNIVDDIIRKYGIKGRGNDEQVKFIPEEEFRKIVDCAITPEQRCLLWLAFDIGENINSLLELEKDDFKRQTNPDTKEPEYLVILSKEKLKRSRTPRSEFTNYRETVKFLDIVINNLKPTDKTVSNKYIKNKKLSDIHGENKLFKFTISSAQKFLKRAVEKAKVRCMPEGQKVTWKDLRSSMACDLLNKKWSKDEVNARLGHKPSSRVIDRYFNYLALDRKKPKKKVYESNLQKMQSELETTKDLAALQGQRLESNKQDIEMLKQKNKLYGEKLIHLFEILQSGPKEFRSILKKDIENVQKMVA